MDYKTASQKSKSRATGHFRNQRITSLLLIPLSPWLLVLLNKSLHAPHAETLAWLAAPYNALAIMLWSILVNYHAALGLQVVIEDYVATVPVRRLAIVGTNLIFLLLGIAALSAMVFILFKEGNYGFGL